MDEGRHFGSSGIQLMAWDLVLTMDVLVVMFALGVAINVAIADRFHPVAVLPAIGAVVFGFATWRARSYKAPPPPPTDNVVLRGLGLVLLSVGGLLSLIGAFIAASATYSSLTSAPGESIPLYAVPAFWLPLILGHAVAFAGAKIRSSKRQ